MSKDCEHEPDLSTITYADGYLTVQCALCEDVGELHGEVEWSDNSMSKTWRAIAQAKGESS